MRLEAFEGQVLAAEPCHLGFLDLPCVRLMKGGGKVRSLASCALHDVVWPYALHLGMFPLILSVLNRDYTSGPN